MDIFLAGEQFAGVADKVRRRLFSYYYNRKSTKHVDSAFEWGQDLFLDSGAFSAMNSGKLIDIEQFAQYIKEHGHKFRIISSLDDIGNAEGSYNNLKTLESLGVNPCPVYHAREDEKWLKKYLDEGYPYILIGGMVPETTAWLMGWLDGLFSRILCNEDGTARVKLHGFGLTDQQLMFRYPWASVDSTSWLFTGSFGCCVFMEPSGLKKVVFSDDSPAAKKIDAPHYRNLSSIEKSAIDNWLERFGVTAEQCAEHYSFRNVVNSRTFQEMEKYGTQTFQKAQEGFFDDYVF